MTEIGASQLSVETIGALEISRVRELLPVWLGGFVEAESEAVASTVQDVASALMNFDDTDVQQAVNRICTTGTAYDIFEADPVARALIRAFVRSLITESYLKGADRLVAAHEAGPVLLLSNHLSYCDAQVTDLLLADGGYMAQADQLIALAGPKVYATLFRRLASLGLGTIKTAQSSSLVHNDTGMSSRQVAQVAMRTVELSHTQMDAGGLVVLYGEGSRSRTGQLGSFLKAVRRYARKDPLTILPVALSGTNRLMPLDLAKMCPAPVTVEFGDPIHVSKHEALDAVQKAWRQIAEILPEPHRPYRLCAPVA